MTQNNTIPNAPSSGVTKVLIIGSVYPRHPQDNEVPWLRQSVHHLRQQNIAVQVLAPSWKGLHTHTIDNCTIHRFRYAPKSLETLTHDEGAPNKMAAKPWLQLLAIPYILSGILKTIALQHKYKFDVFHVHWPFPHGLIALPAKWIFGVPMVLNFHGASLLLMQKKPWIAPIMRFIISKAKFVLANSSFTAQKIQAVQQVPVQLSPYGTTLSVHSPNKPASNTNKPFTILFVGRHIERKGIPFLMQATALCGPGVQLRIVGDGDQTNALKQQAQQLKCDIVFTGPISPAQLTQEYQNADVFVLPAIVDSRGDTEGLGVVLIEALCFGLPVIASNVGGIPDVIIHQKTGLLVPPGDTQALASALQTIQSNPALRTTLLEGAQEHIHSFFNWDVITHQIITTYTQAIKNNH
jgi:glycosyltransferase involved in cell wall biosynthesis